jgi:quinol-cytochrome oxidoreductase complex cytochrome b subunit
VGQGEGGRYAFLVTSDRAWARATRIALIVVGALVAILIVTGLWLTFRYRPDRAEAYANVQSLEHGKPLLTMRHAHLVATWLLAFAGLVLGVASFGLFVVRKRWVALSLPLFGALLAFIAAVSGLLLPWDQIALNSVTVGSNIEGYTKILGNDNVKYVIVGRTEIEPNAFVAWFWTHVGATVAVVAVLAATAFVMRRRRASSEEPLGGEVGAETERAELLPDN